jgi:DNA-nicking Smr family endonuclease
MTRKLTDDEIKTWQHAVKEGFRDFAPALKEKLQEKPKVQTGTFDARLDLHGLTLERAHKKFLEFVYFAIMDDLKKLLVITGKGSGNTGRIREELPKWCSADYLAPLISSCKQAELRHGGEGAFYVTLRK